jgi:hypothetical protein
LLLDMQGYVKLVSDITPNFHQTFCVMKWVKFPW